MTDPTPISPAPTPSVLTEPTASASMPQALRNPARASGPSDASQFLSIMHSTLFNRVPQPGFRDFLKGRGGEGFIHHQEVNMFNNLIGLRYQAMRRTISGPDLLAANGLAKHFANRKLDYAGVPVGDTRRFTLTDEEKKAATEYVNRCFCINFDKMGASSPKIKTTPQVRPTTPTKEPVKTTPVKREPSELPVTPTKETKPEDVRITIKPAPTITIDPSTDQSIKNEFQAHRSKIVNLKSGEVYSVQNSGRIWVKADDKIYYNSQGSRDFTWGALSDNKQYVSQDRKTFTIVSAEKTIDPYVPSAGDNVFSTLDKKGIFIPDTGAITYADREGIYVIQGNTGPILNLVRDSQGILRKATIKEKVIGFFYDDREYGNVMEEPLRRRREQEKAELLNGNFNPSVYRTYQVTILPSGVAQILDKPMGSADYVVVGELKAR